MVTMTDGRPFLAEYRAGSGRVFLCAVDAGTAWSDLPVRGIFAPLLHRSMVYLAAAQSTDAGARIGERLTLSLPRAYGESRHEFAVACARRHRGSCRTAGPRRALLFTTSPAEMPGLYTLQYAGADRPQGNRTTAPGGRSESPAARNPTWPPSLMMISQCSSRHSESPPEHVTHLQRPGSTGTDGRRIPLRCRTLAHFPRTCPSLRCTGDGHSPDHTGRGGRRNTRCLN